MCDIIVLPTHVVLLCSRSDSAPMSEIDHLAIDIIDASNDMLVIILARVSMNIDKSASINYVVICTNIMSLYVLHSARMSTIHKRCEPLIAISI